MERQRRHSRREWQGLVAAWTKSGELAETFAARHGVKARTLSWWGSELRRSAASKKSGGLLPVQVVHARADAASVELALGGVVMRFERGAAPQYVAAVTRALLDELRDC